MKTLNRLPTLDKGWVGLFSSSMMSEDFRWVLKNHYRGVIDQRLLETVHVILSIRCPLFVQLALSEYGISMSSEKNNLPIEAYVPSVEQIRGPDLQTSSIIQQDIEQTTNSLLINPRAYQQDGCDSFVAQIISPISVYNTILASATLSKWCNFIAQKHAPSPIEAYRLTVQECLNSEYNEVVIQLREKNAQKVGHRK